MRNIDEILVSMHSDIHQFIKKNLNPASSKKENIIKGYLSEFIKEDPNVICFSNAIPSTADFDEIIFVIPEFIKKACINYAKTVKNYQCLYFTNDDQTPILSRLLNTVLDKFYGNIEYYMDELIEKITSEEVSLNNNACSLADFIKKDFSKTKSILIHDKDILQQAHISLGNTSPYSLIAYLKLIDDIIDELTKLKLADVIREKLNNLEITQPNQPSESLKKDCELLLKNAQTLASTTIDVIKQNSSKKQGDRPIVIAFIEMLWQKIEPLSMSKKAETLQVHSHFFNPVGNTTDSLLIIDGMDMQTNNETASLLHFSK